MAAQQTFGLDIGESSVKAVQLAPFGKTKKLMALGTIPTPIGGFSSGNDYVLSAMSQVIKKLVKDSKITTKKVNIALPESKIYTRVIEMPPISDEDLVSALKWEAEQYIPLSLDEVNMDWQVLNRPQNPTPDSKMEILLSAAPKKLIDIYVKLAEMSDLELVSLEPETLAAVRALTENEPDPPTTLALVMGAEETNLIIIKNSLVVFTRTISSGGNAVTRAISTNFGLEFIQAEEYKKTYGLEKESFEGKVAEVVKPMVDIIVGEIKRAVAFYQSKKADDIVKRLVLVGSPTLLPGMVRYLTEAVGIETQQGDPWVDVEIDSKLFPDALVKGPTYALAAGLAKKEINE
ncbi:type IV pilus assembly protein PilM [Candidatus Microgenomates bacterium]|nr:type IV pilus assembly protein PilM [Candidatus Microgenomates bacterium]